MDEYVKLAKNAIETYIKTGKTVEVPKGLPDEFYNARKGIFVTIYTTKGKKKELRGCIGTFRPTKECLAQEIIDNAISSAIHDYRFSRISNNELSDLEYEISLLEDPEPIDSVKRLDPIKYGVIVKSKDGRTGLLLPDIDGVETPEHQISIACQKAGIDPASEEIHLYRFTVEKHK